MEIDLYKDWVEYLKTELLAFGYDTSKLLTSEDVVHTFLNLIKRLVKPIPRTILKARTFNCPPELMTGLSLLEQKIISGQDVSPHLSKLLKTPSYNDPLLNDWGIHHIHLGENIESDGFIGRTGPVLFARFDNAHAYLIDVLPHGSWTLQRLVKDLHENWPDSIKHFRLNGVVGLSRTVSDSDLVTLRKNNINSMVDVGNAIYAPIGGGYSSSGLSTAVVIQSDRYRSRISQMQETIILNIKSIADEATESGAKFPSIPKFELQIDNGMMYAIETNSMVRLKLGEL